MATLEIDMIETIMGQIDDTILSEIKEIYKSIIE